MKMSLVLGLAFALSLHGAAMASQKLAEQKQCFGCHSIKEDGAGPSFQKIAKAWKGRKDAQAVLVKTIRQGSTAAGGPHWNKATMPDQGERPLVSDAEAKRLVRWILKQ
jgi:cytochrome c